MEQRIHRLRRNIGVAALIASAFLLIAFACLAWLETRAAAQQSEATLDSAVHTVEDLTVAARNEAFERLAIAGRQVNAGLRAGTDAVPLAGAEAQALTDAASYIAGVGVTLLNTQAGRLVTSAGSPRRTDPGRDRINTDAEPDASVAAELNRGRSWSGVVRRNGEWLAVGYRPLDPPFTDSTLRLETPLPLREVERYLQGLPMTDAFIVLHDASGLVRFRTREAPDAESADQIEPLLHAQGWVSRQRALGDTELSVLAAYRPLGGARRALLWSVAGLACAMLSGLCLLRYAWRRTTLVAFAPLRDVSQLVDELQRGRYAHALTLCGRSDDIGTLAGALVQHARERPVSTGESVLRATGATA